MARPDATSWNVADTLPEVAPVSVTVWVPRSVAVGTVQVKVTVPWAFATWLPSASGSEVITPVTVSPGVKPVPTAVCCLPRSSTGDLIVMAMFPVGSAAASAEELAVAVAEAVAEAAAVASAEESAAADAEAVAEDDAFAAAAAEAFGSASAEAEASAVLVEVASFCAAA